MNIPRFLADRMLRRLGRFLRAAGFDVADIAAGETFDDALRRAVSEGRTVVTINTRFPRLAAPLILLESRSVDDQAVELLRRFPPIDLSSNLFRRCMICNAPVRADDAPPPTAPAAGGRTFTRCPVCGRSYWEGSHTDRMRERIARWEVLLDEIRRSAKEGMPPPIDRREFDAFLREVYPLLGLSARGYRKVRFSLRRPVRGRLRELGLSSLDRYLSLVRRDRSERSRLGALLAVTISRFFRDRGRWLLFGDTLFPRLEKLAAGGVVRAWSVGCASGEEPFTLRMVWRESGRPDDRLEIIAGDISARCLERAGKGIYPESSVHNVPSIYRKKYFTPVDGGFLLAEDIRRSVSFDLFDWRSDAWPKGFHLILCRNGIFTYLDDAGRAWATKKLAASSVEGGFLWIGGNERLGDGAAAWSAPPAPPAFSHSGARFPPCTSIKP